MQTRSLLNHAPHNLVEMNSWLASKHSTQPHTHQTPSAAPRLTANHLNSLWIALTSLYGALFTRKHGETDDGTWLDVLGDLTPKALESGVQRLKHTASGDKFAEFPPNSLEFRRLCIAYYDALKLPDVGKAWQEFKNARLSQQAYFSHPVVQYTAVKISEQLTANETEQALFLRFKEAYEHVCWFAKQGHPVPHTVWNPPRTTVASEQTSREGFNTLRTLLGMTPR